jgi:hypothetical protein
MEVFMKKVAKIMLAVVIGIVFTASSALAGDPPFSGARSVKNKQES